MGMFNTLPTDPDVIPDRDDIEIEERECIECGQTGYVARTKHNGGRHPPSRCEPCTRDDFRRYLDPDEDTAIDRTDALDRIRAAGALPFRDYDGRLITEVDTRRAPGGGSYVRSITWIVPEDCPECDHDRADLTRWAIWTAEHGENLVCRACDHVIREESTL